MGLASHGTLSGVLPVGTRFMNNQMHAAGLEVRSGQDLAVHSNFVSAGYFGAVGISLLLGRDFSSFDGERASRSPSSTRPRRGCSSARRIQSARVSARDDVAGDRSDRPGRGCGL